MKVRVVSIYTEIMFVNIPFCLISLMKCRHLFQLFLSLTLLKIKVSGIWIKHLKNTSKICNMCILMVLMMVLLFPVKCFSLK